MRRSTTIEAYRKAEDSGLLSKLRLRVFKIVCDHGPATANELRAYFPSSSNSGVYMTRLSELERMSLVMIVDKRPCKITGNNALVWGITNNSPIKLPIRKTKKDKIKNVITDLVSIQNIITDWELKDRLSNVISDISAI